MNKHQLSEVMSQLAYLRHKKTPITLEKRREMQRLSTEAKRRKKALANKAIDIP